MAKYRIATRDDIVAYYGNVPSTMKAVAVLDGETIVAIGGIAHEKGVIKMFMDMQDEAVNYPVTLVKAARKVMQIARESGYRLIYAQASDELISAPRFLQRLGFEPMNIEGIYQWRS